jgi:hypothetical protein
MAVIAMSSKPSDPRTEPVGAWRAAGLFGIHTIQALEPTGERLLAGTRNAVHAPK